MVAVVPHKFKAIPCQIFIVCVRQLKGGGGLEKNSFPLTLKEEYKSKIPVSRANFFINFMNEGFGKK